VEEQKPGVKEQNLSVGDGFIGMLNAFVDPAGLAKRVPAPLSWLWPLITLVIVYTVSGYLMMPYTMSLIDLRMNQQFSQQNTPVEQAERARNVAHMIYQFLPVATPVFVILFTLLFAWLVSAMASMAGLRAKFRDIFSLMTSCGLIPALQAIATYIVLHAKGDEITSQEQLQPPFGIRPGQFLFDFRDLVSDRADVRFGLSGKIQQGQSVLCDHAGLGAAAGDSGDTGDGAGKSVRGQGGGFPPPRGQKRERM